ncbi:uncharacterized protein F4817DRAFT_311939 [Daldinia loculata]|uniref:uncharacterized protein n=1 Tax=Daldinia loculata TaxID=103429 RepID=UPI0020C3A185|nr:uncharacterized protein F4817DRAFT_311939 [Daldinia loculata]KAI1651111.1 hypothetical protein F4817DRAFT_311939 [Daldinia loculata]
MNAPEGEVRFVPKQALAPTPQLYDELVFDSMENLAKASLDGWPVEENWDKAINIMSTSSSKSLRRLTGIRNFRVVRAY